MLLQISQLFISRWYVSICLVDYRNEK